MIRKHYAMFCALLALAAVYHGRSWLIGTETGGRVTVRGRVTVDGEPLSNGKILFTPDASTSAPAASASIQKGRYALIAAEGIFPGTYQVTVAVVPTKEEALQQMRARRESVKGRRPTLTTGNESYQWPNPQVIPTDGHEVELNFAFPAESASAR